MAVTLETWIAYAAARGQTVANETASDHALQRATDFVTYRYVANLLPAYDASLPVVEPAIYEAARLELATPFVFSKVYTPAEQKVLTELDGIKWTLAGSSAEPYSSAPTTPLLDSMFLPYMVKRSGITAALLSV